MKGRKFSNALGCGNPGTDRLVFGKPIPAARTPRLHPTPEMASTGIAEVDAVLQGGLPPCALIEITGRSNAVGIVVSESSVVRLFCHGELVGEIIPEVWMTDHGAHLRGSVKREQVGEFTILTPSRRQASIAK